jgi:hypothetical protein
MKRADDGNNNNKTQSNIRSALQNPSVWVPLAAAGATIGGVLTTRILTRPKDYPPYAKPADPLDDAYLYRYGLGNYLLKRQEEQRRRANVYKGARNR